MRLRRFADSRRRTDPSASGRATHGWTVAGRAMRVAVPVALMALTSLAGCGGNSATSWVDGSDAVEPQMLGPVSMRIHPIFTRIKDFDGDGKPDGIEALVEFQDQFGDPTKAAGRVVFELFDFRRGYPDPRGQRLANPWIASLATLQDQRDRWNRTARTYTFQLAYPGIRTNRPYVLTAMFELAGGDGRFFDRTILEPAGNAEP